MIHICLGQAKCIKKLFKVEENQGLFKDFP